MAKISTAPPAFNGTGWYIEPVGGGSNPNANSGPYTISSNGLTLTLDCGTNSYDGYYTSYNNDGPWDLTSSQVLVQFTPNFTTNSDSGMALLGADDYTGIAFHVQGGGSSTNSTLAVQQITDSAATNVYSATYNATNHAWLRIREASGTVFFETAPDGATWTTFYSDTVETVGEWTAATSHIQLYCGSLNNTNLAGSAVFTNFNTPGSGTVTNPPSSTLLQNFTDAFTGTALNSSVWTVPTGATVANGELSLAQNTTYSNSVFSIAPYNLTGSYAYVKLLPDVTSGDNGDSGLNLGDQADLNGWGIGVTGGDLYVQIVTAGTYATPFTTTYNATNHAWVRIRESAGTIYFDTSPDSTTWTNVYSTTNEAIADIGNVYVGLFAGNSAGSNVGSAGFESFNTPGTGGGSGGGGGGSTGTTLPVPLLGMYEANNAFPGAPASWPSGPTTNVANTYIAMDSTDLFNTYGTPFIQQCTQYGLIPFVEIEPWDYNQTGVLFSAIEAGSWDTYFEQLGSAIAASGKPCIVTFAHEMNVSGQYPWAYNDTGCGPGGGNLTAAEWVTGWQYVHDKVKSYANGYAVFMWAPGAVTGGSTTTDPTPWWPGASYVDAVGIDGYEGLSGSPTTFAGIFSSALTSIRALGWSGEVYVSETNLALMVQSGGDSITTFVQDMKANGMSGILEFEDTGLPTMTAAQWTEYNNAIAANYVPSGITVYGGAVLPGAAADGTGINGGNVASQWYDNTVITGLNAQAALMNGGSLEIYSGSQPALDGALSGTLLVSLPFAATAFATSTASGGTVTAVANTIGSGVAGATGTAGYFALVSSGGATILTGSVGTASADLVLSSLSITSGVTVECSSFTLSQAQAGS